MFRENLLLFADRAVPIVLIDGAIDEVATVNSLLKFARQGDGYNEELDTGDAVFDFIYTWDAARGITSAASRQVKDAEALLTQALNKVGFAAHEATNMSSAIDVAGKTVEALASTVSTLVTHLRPVISR